MKKLYTVTVYGESQSIFKEHYTEEEINIINRFFDDMIKHRVSSYDVPSVCFDEVIK